MFPVDEVSGSGSIERFSGLDLYMFYMVKPDLGVAVDLETTCYTLFTEVPGTTVIGCIGEVKSGDRVFDIIETFVGVTEHERHRADLEVWSLVDVRPG